MIAKFTDMESLTSKRTGGVNVGFRDNVNHWILVISRTMGFYFGDRGNNSYNLGK